MCRSSVLYPDRSVRSLFFIYIGKSSSLPKVYSSRSCSASICFTRRDKIAGKNEKKLMLCLKERIRLCNTVWSIISEVITQMYELNKTAKSLLRKNKTIVGPVEGLLAVVATSSWLGDFLNRSSGVLEVFS